MGLNHIPQELQGKRISDIEAGYQMSIAVTEDGQVVSWGNENAVDIFAAKVKKDKI